MNVCRSIGNYSTTRYKDVIVMIFTHETVTLKGRKVRWKRSKVQESWSRMEESGPIGGSFPAHIQVNKTERERCFHNQYTFQYAQLAFHTYTPCQKKLLQPWANTSDQLKPQVPLRERCEQHWSQIREHKRGSHIGGGLAREVNVDSGAVSLSLSWVHTSKYQVMESVKMADNVLEWKRVIL